MVFLGSYEGPQALWNFWDFCGEDSVVAAEGLHESLRKLGWGAVLGSIQQEPYYLGSMLGATDFWKPPLDLVSSGGCQLMGVTVHVIACRCTGCCRSLRIPTTSERKLVSLPSRTGIAGARGFRDLYIWIAVPGPPHGFALDSFTFPEIGGPKINSNIR